MRLIAVLLFASGLAVAAPETGKPAPQSAEELLKTADALVEQVAKMRQLPARGPVARGVLGRPEILAKLKEQIARQYTSQEIQIEGSLLKAMGLLPREVDYEKLQLDLLMEQVAGFYDPFGKKLYIADWLPVPVQAPALAHEITHALQDQHFDLKRFVRPVHDQGDRQLARSALVEGDGTGVMLEFVSHKDLAALPDLSRLMESAVGMGSLGGTSTKVLEQAPAFIRQSLLFPYVSGLRFVQHLRKRYPWSKLAELYKNPPQSTEQILHPSKAKEPPVWLKSAPLPLGAGAKPVREDTFGELQTRLFLEIVGDAKNSEEAAAGWGGDRLVAYQAPGSDLPTIVWLTVWDSDADADEFRAAAQPAMEKLGGFLSPVEGNRVVLLFGVPAAAQQTIVASVLKTWRRTAAPKQ